MDVNVRANTLKLLEENLEILHDFGLGKDFLDTRPKVGSIKK